MGMSVGRTSLEWRICQEDGDTRWIRSLIYVVASIILFHYSGYFAVIGSRLSGCASRSRSLRAVASSSSNV